MAGLAYVALEDRVRPALPHLVPLTAAAQSTNGLVLLPDDVSLVGTEQIAGFRHDTQALRVAALDHDVPVQLELPSGSKAGQYTERSADWVLPLILGVPSSIVASLVATHVQRRLDSWRSKGSSLTPTVRYREVVVSNDAEGAYVVREIEGPADEVIAWLREERGGIPDRGDI